MKNPIGLKHIIHHRSQQDSMIFIDFDEFCANTFVEHSNHTFRWF